MDLLPQLDSSFLGQGWHLVPAALVTPQPGSGDQVLNSPILGKGGSRLQVQDVGRGFSPG